MQLHVYQFYFVNVTLKLSRVGVSYVTCTASCVISFGQPEV